MSEQSSWPSISSTANRAGWNSTRACWKRPRTTTNPLLERVKFLSIFSSNLDEFFMIRVAGLREQAFGDRAPQDYSPDGLRPISQLQRIAIRTQELVAAQYRCWNESVRAALAEQGFRLLKHEQLNGDQRELLDRFFAERAFPILTPMAVDPAHPSPRYHNRALYLAALLDGARGLGPAHLFAVVQLPQVLPRLVPLGQGTSWNSFCSRTPSRPGCRNCSAASTYCRAPRSASRATATSNCSSKSRTTCCG